jgi:hypothetical protein
LVRVKLERRDEESDENSGRTQQNHGISFPASLSLCPPPGSPNLSTTLSLSLSLYIYIYIYIYARARVCISLCCCLLHHSGYNWLTRFIFHIRLLRNFGLNWTSPTLTDSHNCIYALCFTLVRGNCITVVGGKPRKLLPPVFVFFFHSSLVARHRSQSASDPFHPLLSICSNSKPPPQTSVRMDSASFRF